MQFDPNLVRYAPHPFVALILERYECSLRYKRGLRQVRHAADKPSRPSTLIANEWI